MATLYKAEVSTGDPNRFDTNGLLFEDEPTAEAYARDLAMRWTLVSDWRIRQATAAEIESGAVYRLESGRFVRVDEPEDFPGIPNEDADEYEAEVIEDETDGIE